MFPALLAALAMATQAPQTSATISNTNATIPTFSTAWTYIDPAADIQARIIELGGGP